ncbi:MAG: hypothetical protein H7837_02360 [Magnetococcus sp. MYC-9]
MSGFRPGQTLRRFVQGVSSAWRRRKARLSVSRDAQGMFRVRHKQRFAQKVDGNPTARGALHDPPSPRRVVAAGPKWEIRRREWLAGLAEGGLLKGVGCLIILRSSLGFLRELWLCGRELLLRRVVSAPVDFAAFKQDILAGRLQSGCLSPGREPSWGKGGGPELSRLSEPMLHPPPGMREEAERAKISFLDLEEEDLSEDLLEDQAGALRSRLAGVGSEEGKG